MRSWVKKRLACFVVVHTTDDRTIEGVLETDARDGLVLAGASYVETGGNKIALDGQVFVPAEKVSFVQRPHATEWRA